MNQSENFVPRGTKFVGGSVENFRSPGNKIFRRINREVMFPVEQNFQVDQLGIFVPRGFSSGAIGNFRLREMEFHNGSVEKFR